MQDCRSFLVSSDLRFAILAKPRRGQAAVLRDERGILTLVHLARTMSDAENWLQAHPGCRVRIVPANVDVPRTYTYLHDVDHGWLIVSRTDLDAASRSPGDFSPWSRVCGDSFALDEHGDMPKFLKRLDERGVRYRLHDRRAKGDAHVRQYWFPNEAPVSQASKPSSGAEAPLDSGSQIQKENTTGSIPACGGSRISMSSSRARRKWRANGNGCTMPSVVPITTHQLVAEWTEASSDPSKRSALSTLIRPN